MKIVGNVQLVAGGEGAIPHILALLAEEGFQTIGNPDIDIRTYPSLGAKDARDWCERTIMKSVTGTRRVFILVAPNLTTDAQNTMLKTLEEPAGDALIFIVVPSPDSLLATIRSRAQMLTLSTDASVSAIDAHIFLKSSPQMRLDMLKPLYAKDDDDERDISALIMFLSSLERILYTRMPQSRDGIEAVYRARKYASDKGSLLKILLEHVALLAPVLK